MGDEEDFDGELSRSGAVEMSAAPKRAKTLISRVRMVGPRRPKQKSPLSHRTEGVAAFLDSVLAFERPHNVGDQARQ